MVKEDFPMEHAGMASDIKLQKKYFDEEKVFIVQIESTKACPQLCKYCYRDSKPNSPHGLSSEKIREILDSAANMEVKMIDWLGGDPLIRPDWKDLCKYASDLGMINNIWTSGIPLEEIQIAREVVEATQGGFISTHLDSLDPDLYAIMHQNHENKGGPHNIWKIMKGIKNCIDMGKDPNSMVNCITFTKPLA